MRAFPEKTFVSLTHNPLDCHNGKGQHAKIVDGKDLRFVRIEEEGSGHSSDEDTAKKLADEKTLPRRILESLPTGDNQARYGSDPRRTYY
jgi:hypothetical protein